jgi:1-deoxy-D-xylulose-5-phosphate reductoisomerase
MARLAMTSTTRQRVAILGSTGSVGRSTLDVVGAHPDRFELVALAAGQNADALERQIERARPRFASLSNGTLQRSDVEIVDGTSALSDIATHPDVDIVVVATNGHAAIQPTIDALLAGKVVALANKETIVAAGEIVMPIAQSHPGALRPVDSEHSAVWQCLGSDHAASDRVRRLILTGSGGPFRGWTKDQLQTVTPADALQHPNWEMGAKITIDSATLMNKGLEVIEAHWLFGCPLERIDVVIHPQSLVHSMVEFADGAIMAQLGSHDMRLPIQYALTWPDRIPAPGRHLDVLALSRLDFEAPDHAVFPLLSLAREAVLRGSTFPTVLSAADTVAVDAFLGGDLPFVGIAEVIDETLNAHVPDSGPLTIEAITEADDWASGYARSRIRVRRS